MKFKDLYPALAERHPGQCPLQGKTVRLTSMVWLNEVQRDLQEIAIYRDGLWHLKESAPAHFPIKSIEKPIHKTKHSSSESDNPKARIDRKNQRERVNLPQKTVDNAHVTETAQKSQRCVSQRLRPLPQVSRERYNREELYEKVWAQPMQKVAKEYGVSDVALAKACKRRKVPVPGRGFWEKKAAGKPVPSRPPLPPSDEPCSSADVNQPNEATSSSFRESIRDLLRNSPMKFKELYPLIAKQHAEHCPVQGQTVSLGSMAWLMKIQLALEEIAINRDGLWQLKETASVPDDGQQSDEQVWAYPI